jgi:hypothetical protein
MPGHRNPLRVTGMLQHIAEKVDSARSNARNSAEGLRANVAAFAEEKMLDVRYVDLDIQFIGARNLPVMDVGGTADPYFIAKLDDKVKFMCVCVAMLYLRPTGLTFWRSSSVQVGTLTPVWNETWRVINVPSHASLNVEVLDKDDTGITDDYIGKFTTTINTGAKEVEIAGPLLKRNRGSFWLKVRCSLPQLTNKSLTTFPT